MRADATSGVGGQKANLWKELGQLERWLSARRMEWASVASPF